MSVSHEQLCLFRIRTLQQAYSAQQSDLPLLEERIGLLEDVMAYHRLPGQQHTNPILLAECHYEMGRALYERYLHLRSVRDLELAGSHLELAISDLAPEAYFPGPRSVLGSVLQEHAYIKEDSNIAEKAVLMHRSLWSSAQTAPPLERAYHSQELGKSLGTHCFTVRGSESLLLQSVECLKASQTLYVEAGLTDHMCAFALSSAFASCFYSRKANRSYLEDAISYGTLALKLCGSHHRDVYAVQALLSFLRLRQIEHFGSDASPAVNQIIENLRDAITKAPLGWVAVLTHHLAHALQVRSLQQGDKEDLTEAITRASGVLAILEPNEPIWCQLQAGLSVVHRKRFEVTGMPGDIEAAASAANLAVLNAVTGTRRSFIFLAILAVCRGTQFIAFGDLAHLNECIVLHEQIIQSSPLQSTNWNVAASNMLESFHLRYQATRNMADLNRAAEMVPLILSYRDKTAMIAPTDLHIAGDVFLSLFEVTGALQDLERATELLREAVEDYTTEDHLPHKQAGAYVKALRIRAEVLHDGQFALKALQLQQRILGSLPDTHPDHAQALCGLAHLQLLQDPSSDSAAGALTALVHALNNRQCPAYRRLKDVSDVLSYLAKHPLKDEYAIQVSAVYSSAIALLPEVASFGLNPTARISVMTEAGPLTTWGATHAVSIGQLGVALEMIEAGRSVFWTQNLQLRTSFMDLPKTIAGRLTDIAYALARPMSEGLDVARRDRELARRRQLGDEFRSVLDEARLIPGFENLLRNASFASIAKAATHHPIVIFIADENSGHAIIIQAQAQCGLVKLPGTTTTVLQKLASQLETRRKHARSSRGIRKAHVESERPDDVYQELWTLVMRPVVEALQWPRSEGRERRRLTLCPTGAFMQVPLHAAGIYTGDHQVSCSDYFVASYTPSIAALLHAQQSAKPVRHAQADTLLVAVDQPFQGTPLPMTRKEADTAQRLVSPSAKVVRISSCDEMLNHIQSASILHLACHGTQDPANALQSSFHLEDGLLPVSRLMELELPSAFLAVLSACETAKADSAQPDQAIYLAATMLFVGFKSVVATMWFMGDAEGPDIAESIYSALFSHDATSEYLDPDDVPYALDDAVQKLRRSGLDPSFWATYVHIGI